MQLTPLALVLLLAAVPAFLASAYVPAIAPAAIAWMTAITVVAALDALAARASARFEVERSVDEKLSLGTENPVRIALRNRTARTMRLRLKDTIPHEFGVSRRQHEVVLPPYGSADISYTVVPTQRGDFRFGDIFVQGLGRLLLGRWQRTIPAEADVKVYPNLRDVRRYDLLARADRLRDIGLRTIRWKGRGTEFESLREYVPDDDFRMMDWKATARMSRPIVRQYQVERSQTVILVLETGRMMTAQVGGMAKLDYAVNSALMLAHVAQHTDDAVGMLAFGADIETYVPPHKGSAHVNRILEQLYRLQPTLQEPDYSQAFSLLAQRCRKRALIVIFADLVDVDASGRLLGHIAALRSRHLPLLVTIQDTDIQAAAAIVPDSIDDVYERAVAADVLAERKKALAWARSRGAIVVDAPANELTPAAVNQYLQIKATRRL